MSEDKIQFCQVCEGLMTYKVFYMSQDGEQNLMCGNCAANKADEAYPNQGLGNAIKAFQQLKEELERQIKKHKEDEENGKL